MHSFLHLFSPARACGYTHGDPELFGEVGYYICMVYACTNVMFFYSFPNSPPPPPPSHQTILFTADEDILARVAAHDDSFPSQDDPHQDLLSPSDSERPSTANTYQPLEVRTSTIVHNITLPVSNECMIAIDVCAGSFMIIIIMILHIIIGVPRILKLIIIFYAL